MSTNNAFVCGVGGGGADLVSGNSQKSVLMCKSFGENLPKMVTCSRIKILSQITSQVARPPPNQ